MLIIKKSEIMALLKILYATEIYKIIPVTKGRVQRIYFIHLDLSFSVLAFFNNAHFTESQGEGYGYHSNFFTNTNALVA